MILDPTAIAVRLARFATANAEPTGADTRPAAVLVVLCPDPQPFTLLTLRSELLPQHAGQISFPGGRPNAGDASPEATALREAAEETGLDPHAVRILGRLPVVSGLSSGFAITPVVGWVDVRPSLVHDTREVAALIDLPLALALDPACYCVGELRRDGVVKEFWYLDYAGHRVWGATARVLRSLALALAD